MRYHRPRRIHVFLPALFLALLIAFMLVSNGGSAQKTDIPRARQEPNEDAAVTLQHALSSTEVVSAIIELQSEPVVTHENNLRSAELRETKLNLSSAQAQAYESLLVTEQENFKQLAYQLSPKMLVRTELRTLLNAISIEAPGTEIAAIATLPGVKRVELVRTYHATLNQSVALINAQAAWTKVGGSGSAGQGIKIAILDTGIDINNPLFAPAGFVPPAGFPKGTLSFANNKVIAARVFLDASMNPGATPLDQNGHGTNVAGIAAGDLNTTSPLAQISGVAPRAFLGNYRVLDANGNGFDDLIAQGLQSALADGFDIASLSLGGAADPTLNILDQAVENAVAAGMIVTVAAGNDGDNGVGTIQSPGVAPSAITVGSSTNSHIVGPGANITVSGGTPSLTNIGSTVGEGGAPGSVLSGTLGPAVYADMNALDNNNRGCAGVAAGSLSGKIALIERGNCGFAAKVATASSGGAVGVIIYNKSVAEGTDGGDVVFPIDVSGPPAASIPAVFISRTNGLALRDWLTAPHPGAQVSMSAVALLDLVNPADLLSSFSSRGPSSLKGLKPDLAAPGDQIYSGAITANNPAGVSDPSGFAAVSGTSQATPHVAGAAALLKQLHPTWTPLQIKSALISSANNSVFTDSSKTVKAGVLDVGAGRADLSLGSSVNATFSPASLSYGFVTAGGHPAINLQVTNQTTGADTFSITVQDLNSGTGVTVSPALNSVSPAAGQSATVAINLNTLATATSGDHTGYVVVTDSNNQVLRIPYWVRTQPAPTVQFIQSNFSATEGDPSGVAHITLNRIGDTSGTATVDYATSDGTASQRTRYIPALGTLVFGAGQSVASFDIIIINDGYVEQTQTINLALSNAVGATLGTPKQAVVFLDDDEEAPNTTTNPIDDPNYFVTQQYYDFLNRLPDPGGFAFWLSQVNAQPPCANGDLKCLTVRRVNVSDAFFFEQEYQQTGAYVYRLYRIAYGNHQPFPDPFPDTVPTDQLKAAHLPAYAVFSADRARVVGGANLAQAQLDLATQFVSRPEFVTKYPASLATPDQFIDAVLATIQTDLGVNLASERAALITLYNAGGRGAVMYRLADDNAQTNPINNRPLIDAEYSRAFVATEYFGYLRRDADMHGINFWLEQVSLAPLRDVPKQHAMVCSFITSAEYQQRFSVKVTHQNGECN